MHSSVPSPTMLQVQVNDEILKLLPEKAVYCPAQKTIIASDLHWGKAGHFRKNGIAVPLQSQQEDEKILADIIRRHKAEKLIIAGDMFHSGQNGQTDNFLNWRTQHSELAIELVSGNHDILHESVYHRKNITIHPETLDLGNFIISHDQMADAAKFHIHGHIHPCFIASGKARNSLRLPCFCMDGQRLVLPSFGRFTGGYTISANEYRHIYIIAGNEVIQWQ